MSQRDPLDELFKIKEPEPGPVSGPPPEPPSYEDNMEFEEGITREDIIKLIDQKLKKWPSELIIMVMKKELTSEAMRYKSLWTGQSTRGDLPTISRNLKEREIIIDVIKKNYGNVINEFKGLVKKYKEREKWPN